MPAATNGMLSNGGPSVASRNGGSSFINGKGNASAFGNNIAQTNGNGAIVPEEQLTKPHGNGSATGNGHPAANGDGVPLLNGNAHLSDGTQLGRAEETEDVSFSTTLADQMQMLTRPGSSSLLSLTSSSPLSKGLTTRLPRSTLARPTAPRPVSHTMCSSTSSSPQTWSTVSR